MANNEEKVSKFVQAITAYAEEQSKAIREEIEAYKAERLLNAEQDVLKDAYQMIQRETADMRNECMRDASDRHIEARGEVLERRREITEEVFTEAKARIAAFTQSVDYAPYLCSLLKEMTDVLPADGTVYMLSRKDEAHLPAIQALVPAGSRVELTDSFVLGGLYGVHRERGIIADNTLETKLDLQREWFTKSSGLTVG